MLLLVTHLLCLFYTYLISIPAIYTNIFSSLRLEILPLFGNNKLITVSNPWSTVTSSSKHFANIKMTTIIIHSLVIMQMVSTGCKTRQHCKLLAVRDIMLLSRQQVGVKDLSVLF